jgi:hypothetical protein
MKKIKQIEESLLLKLLQEPGAWKSKFDNLETPYLEELYTQVGVYTISLFFIHKSEIDKKILFLGSEEQYIHLLEGYFHIELGSYEKQREFQVLSQLDLPGGESYYSNSEVNGYLGISTSSTSSSFIKLTKDLDREELAGQTRLTEERKEMMLGYFISKMSGKTLQSLSEANKSIDRGDWVRVNSDALITNELKMQYARYSISREMAFVIKADEQANIDVRFKSGERRVLPRAIVQKMTDAPMKDSEIKKIEKEDEED